MYRLKRTGISYEGKRKLLAAGACGVMAARIISDRQKLYDLKKLMISFVFAWSMTT